MLLTCFTAEFSSVGAGLFVQESINVVSSSVANNTALYWKYSNRVDVYCYSNNTNDQVTIVLPSGLKLPLSSSRYHDSYSVQKKNPAGVRFLSSQSNAPPGGIYTCRVLTSQKKLMEMSFGIYSSPIGEWPATIIYMYIYIYRHNLAHNYSVIFSCRNTYHIRP